MNIASPYGNSYESEFFDVPLEGLGVPASMGDIYSVHYLETKGVNFEPSVLNPLPGSADLYAPRDIGGIPCPSQAILIDGPVSGGVRDFFNYNADIERFDPNPMGPNTGGSQDITTSTYLAYLNSQLQNLTEE